MARELYQHVKSEDAPKLVERMLKAYVVNRTADDETFAAFANRHEPDALRKMAEEVSA